MHYYVEKQVFSWRAKKVQICCIINVLKQVFSWRNRKQSLYLMHYYVSKQVFSWRAKNTYIFDALLLDKGVTEYQFQSIGKIVNKQMIV